MDLFPIIWIIIVSYIYTYFRKQRSSKGKYNIDQNYHGFFVNSTAFSQPTHNNETKGISMTTVENNCEENKAQGASIGPHCDSSTDSFVKLKDNNETEKELTVSAV